MIFITSHKPFSESKEYALNQGRAAVTWSDLSCVERIYYFGHYEEELNQGDKALFARKFDHWPRIKDMVAMASQLVTEYVALINADIVLTVGFNDVVKRMSDLSLPAATSYRYEFDPAKWPDTTDAVRHKEDRGMDIFIAKPRIWKEVFHEIPDYLRVGHNRWDSWMCGWFCDHLGYGFRQFTDMRCVFHPKHGGRGTPPHGEEIAAGNEKYFTLAKCPSPL